MSIPDPENIGGPPGTQNFGRRKDEYISGLLELVNDLVLSLSLGTQKCLYINQAGETIYDREVADFYDMPHLWLEMVHHDDQFILRKNLQRISELREFNQEFRIVQSDGTIRWMQGKFQLILDPKGIPVAVGAIAKDVTNRINAERRLDESMAIYESLVESLPINVFRKDEQGRLVFCNRKYCETIGRPLDQLIGLSDYDLFDHELAEKYQNDDRWVIETGKLFHDIEYHPSGEDEYLFVEVHKSAVVDSRGRRVGIQGMFWDVTDRKKAELALQSAKDLAEAASKAKSDFLANVSHEIRTPLNAVIGMTDLLLQSRHDDSQTEYLQMIQDSGNALLTLINDILDFSKIEAGKLVLETAWFEIRDRLGDIVRTLALRAHENGLELICNIGPEVPHLVLGDADRLRQVIVNLVGNSIKFTKQGQIDLSVECVHCEASSARIRMTVADTGIGIPTDKLESIFKEFEQADTSTTREYGGTGLGLSIARHLVELMGGKLQVTSQEGQGSQFFFELDLPYDPTVTLDTKELAGRTALVAVENLASRQSVRDVLESWELETYGAESHEEAIKVLKGMSIAERPVDFLIAENVPSSDRRLDGSVLARLVERDEQIVSPRILLLTRGHRKYQQAFDDVEISASMLQPVKHSELAQRLKQAIDLSVQADTEVGRQDDARSAPLKILLAEDNLVNQRLAIALLEKSGHQVTVVDNGQKAVDLCCLQSFDLILMDIQMPGMDGIQATQLIRNVQQGDTHSGKRVPIIAMTAHALPSDRQRCIEAGMDEYIAKPIRADKLNQVIDEVVGFQTAETVSKSKEEVDSTGMVDWNRAFETVGGDRQLIKELIQVFLDERHVMLAEIEDAIEKQNPKELRRASHSIKGALMHLGAVQVANLGRSLEEMGDANWDKSRSLFGELAEQTKKLTIELGRFKNKT